jgi:polyferredoxin
MEQFNETQKQIEIEEKRLLRVLYFVIGFMVGLITAYQLL